MRHLLVALFTTALVLGGAAGPAAAATVSIEGEELVVAGGAEESRLGMAEGRGIEDDSRSYTFTEETGTLTAGAGCEAVDDGRSVVCSLPGGVPARRIRADMGAGTDLVRLAPATRTPLVIAGGEGTDFLAGGAGADSFDGGPGDDTMYGDAGPEGPAVERSPDVFSGGDGRDRVNYTGHGADQIRVTLDDRADDGAPLEADNVHSDVEDLQGDAGAENTLYGTDGPNFLWGGQQRDLIVGGGGEDILLGDRGDDQIEARDGAADSVSCGEGSDRAVVDAVDGLEPGGCEAVDAPAPPPQEPGSQPGQRPPDESYQVPPLHGTFPVSFPQRSLRPSRRGRFVLRVRCGELAGCSGSVDVRTVKKVRVGRRWQSFALGRRSFSVAGGRTARLSFKLTRRQRAALRRVRKVDLLVRAVEVRPNLRDYQGSLRLRR